jgi:seryl-tRNA synthetase
LSEKRDAYLEKLKARMDQWSAEIDLLSAKADQAKAETRIKYLKQLEDLRARRAEVQDRIARMEQAGESAWEDLKEGLENSWSILKTSLSRAKSEFEQGYKDGKDDSK